MSLGNPATAPSTVSGTGEPPVRVCHIASGDLWAGAEVQVANLLRELRKRSDVEVSAVFLNEGRLAEEVRSAGIDVMVIPESQNGFIALVSKTSGHLRQRRIDILHSHRYKENLLAALVARRCGIRVLVRTQHGMPEPLAGLRYIKQSVLQYLDRWVARRTDRIVVPTVDMREQLERHVTSSNIIAIPNGIDVDRVRSSLTAAQAKERLGIPGNAFTVGTAGRLEPIKRIDLFLRAAKIISERHSDARFIIAGEGRQRDSLDALAIEMGIADRVLLLGHRSDAYDVLRAMDVMAISSDHEGLPMVLLEAMCLEVAVVARAVGGICEVLKNGVSGSLVSASDPQDLAGACLALRSQNTRNALTKNALQVVQQRYSVAQTASQMANLYTSFGHYR